MIPIRDRVREKFRTLNTDFLRGAAILSIGTILARTLGIGYSLTLAAVFSPEDYGFVRYGLTLGLLAALITQPFSQHVIARFIGRYSTNETDLRRIMGGSWLILAALIFITIIFVFPVIQFIGMINIGIVFVFIGNTLFYTYWGLSRGFGASTRLSIAYFLSNLFQLGLVVLLIYIFDISSPILALVIYGVSYFIPLALLQLIAPLPLNFTGVRHTDRQTITEIGRFFSPILASHVIFKLNEALPILLLERYAGLTSIGIYSVATTLAIVFAFIPSSLATLIMPKAATYSPERNRQVLRQLLLLIMVINSFGFLFYMLLVRWVVGSLFGADYVSDLTIYAVTALSSIATGTYGVIAAVFVGAGQAQFETLSRIAGFVLTAVLGFLLIPTYGIQGAAVTGLLSTLLAITIISLASRWYYSYSS